MTTDLLDGNNVLRYLLVIFMQCSANKATSKPAVKVVSVPGKKAGKDAKSPGQNTKHVQEDIHLEDPDENGIEVIIDSDDDILEAKFHDCLKKLGRSMEKYDQQLTICATDLSDPAKNKQWLKDNCKNIEKTGFPKCYDRSFNKIYRKCYGTNPTLRVPPPLKRDLPRYGLRLRISGQGFIYGVPTNYLNYYSNVIVSVRAPDYHKIQQRLFQSENIKKNQLFSGYEKNWLSSLLDVKLTTIFDSCNKEAGDTVHFVAAILETI
uniref:Uncharacterized protein n=1 Tax=Strigamia maritima TaxID=126957 RepID=T1IYN0_STRMM